eukprot:TRINITY_DN1334_c0_g2_i2.p1 TRINITY_DN1334_c0_g2~~TRINITY_DN1334_c0_g2_i2.p1  ORF type:complete len:326 (-),score=25.65 TRINITY_DN1334_c0_g2_i2:169-1146(-)
MGGGCSYEWRRSDACSNSCSWLEECVAYTTDPTERDDSGDYCTREPRDIQCRYRLDRMALVTYMSYLALLVALLLWVAIRRLSGPHRDFGQRYPIIPVGGFAVGGLLAATSAFAWLTALDARDDGPAIGLACLGVFATGPLLCLLLFLMYLGCGAHCGLCIPMVMGKVGFEAKQQEVAATTCWTTCWKELWTGYTQESRQNHDGVHPEASEHRDLEEGAALPQLRHVTDAEAEAQVEGVKGTALPQPRYVTEATASVEVESVEGEAQPQPGHITDATTAAEVEGVERATPPQARHITDAGAVPQIEGMERAALPHPRNVSDHGPV